jgi:hypothetical protein
MTAVAAVSALTLAGCASRPTNATATSAMAGGPDRAGSCAGVAAKIVPLPGAASGNTFADLVMVNHGTATCALPAKPELQYLGADHKPVPVAVGSDQSAPSHQLAPGASAAMAIDYGSDGNPPCDVKIAYVRVTPPGEDLAFDGATHCAHDSVDEEGWVVGSYAAPH